MSPEDEKRANELQKLLKETACKLGEDFDSVLIIATQQIDANECTRFNASVGNVYASLGAAHEFIATRADRAIRIDRAQHG